MNEEPAALPVRVPAGLRDVVERCLAREPAGRYQQANDARAAIEAAGSRPVSRASSRPIAVLPFETLSHDEETECLADALHETLIVDLHRLTALRVMARRSVMAYKGSRKPLPRISAELNGVDAVITGAISVKRDLVEVSVQLVDGATGEIVWTGAYTPQKKDLSRLPREVAGQIAKRIGLETDAKQTIKIGKWPLNSGTFALYAKGRFFLNKLTRDGFEKGLAYLIQAVELDPEEPLAHAAVALAYVLIAHQASVNLAADPFQLAKPFAAKALDLDPALPEAHQALAEIKTYRDWDLY